MTTMQTEYKGFKITYSEHFNNWLINDDGEHGDKICNSLGDCKEWIDALLKKEEKGKFSRFDALQDTHAGIIKVVVTSYAEKTSYGGQHCWISNNGKRSKEHGLKVYDEAIYNKIKSLEVERSRISKEIRDTFNSLDTVKAPEEKKGE